MKRSIIGMKLQNMDRLGFFLITSLWLSAFQIPHFKVTFYRSISFFSVKKMAWKFLNSTILQLLWWRKENSSEKVAQGEILSLVWSSRFLCDAMLRTYSREKIQVMLDWLTKGSLSMLVTVARASKAFVPLKKKQERKGFETYSIQSHARYEKK